MRKFLFGIVLTITVMLVFKYCTDQPKAPVVQQSELIREQIKNVGKLVVTEGYFSEVFTYEDSKEIFGSYLTADKKALVVVNAEVTVAYDLSKLNYELDDTNKILKITSIPKEEISIYPEFQYYDIQADFLNQFEAKDYNRIKGQVKKKLSIKINKSKLKKNAKNRLISELSKFYLLTNSLGWTLQYDSNIISGNLDIENMLL